MIICTDGLGLISRIGHPQLTLMPTRNYLNNNSWSWNMKKRRTLIVRTKPVALFQAYEMKKKMFFVRIYSSRIDGHATDDTFERLSTIG
jgi:hypothetical protein